MFGVHEIFAEPVQVISRDVNGKKSCMTFRDWGAVPVCPLRDPEAEILMVLVGSTCIYSALGSESLSWEDVIGFFA